MRSICLTIVLLLLRINSCQAYTQVSNLLPLEVRVHAGVLAGLRAATFVGDDLYVVDISPGHVFRFDREKELLTASDLPSLPSKPGETVVVEDMKFDSASGFIYVSSVNVRNEAGYTLISRYNMRDRRGAWEIIYTGEVVRPAATVATVRLAISSNVVYANIGAAYFPEEANPPAQDMSSSRGKTIRIDLDTRKVTYISSGHRAVLGLTIDSKGSLWATDNAERGGDKLEKIMPSQNYGWPLEMLGTRYFTYQSGDRSPKAFTKPIYAWVPSIAPSALIEVRDFDAAWNGDLLVGSLKAQSLYRVRFDGDRVQYVEPIWVGHRIRDIVSRSGLIVLATDDGSIIEIGVQKELSATGQLNETGGSDGVFAQCLNCHSFTRQDATTFGPSLENVIGRRIGGDAYAYYSDALRHRDGVWTDDLLTAFLMSPQAFAPGTTMPNIGLNEATARETVKALESLRSTAGH